MIAFGLHGTAFMLIPTWLMAVVLVHELPRLKRFRRDLVGGRVQRTDDHEAWGPFAILAGVIAVRSFVYFGMVTFIPLYYVNVLHTSKAFGSVALTAMLLGGAAGTLTGGPLADRFGRRTVLVGSMIVDPAAGRRLPSVRAGGRARVRGARRARRRSRRSRCTIVMGQEYLPGRLGVSAGVTIGLSIGLGGVGAPLLGLLADARGLTAVFEAVAILPLAGAGAEHSRCRAGPAGDGRSRHAGRAERVARRALTARVAEPGSPAAAGVTNR